MLFPVEDDSKKAREEERRMNFKKTVDHDEGRRRRDETTRQIRKNKKEESLRKRRMGEQQAAETSTETSSSVVNNSTGTSSVVDTTNGRKFENINDIPVITAILSNPSSTTDKLVEATRGFRRILSKERDPQVDEVLQAGVLPYFVRNLTADPEAHVLIFESAWALTNIASTDKTKVVVDAGAIGPLIQLLRHGVANVREQAAWCLGNISGDNAEFRDMVLGQGALEGLLLNMYQPDNMSLLNNVVWTVSNLCRGKPAPDFALISPAIQYLTALLYKEVTDDVMVDAVWALSYLSDGPDERIGAIVATGVTKRLLEILLEKMDTPILLPALRCLGNFVTGNDVQTQAVLDAGILDHLNKFLDSPKRSIRKEACWLASNIAAGTHKQITTLMHNPGTMHRLIDTAMSGAWEPRKEAIWTLSNICTSGKDIHIELLVQGEGIQPLVDILAVKTEARLLVAALDAIEQVLEFGERAGKEYPRLIDEYNGIDHLENLQEHPSEEIYKKTIKIMETYFVCDDDEENENLAPMTTESGIFAFGISSPAKELFPADNISSPSVIQFGTNFNRAF